MVDEMLARSARGLGDRLLRLALGADEQHLAARRHGGATKSSARANSGTVCDRSRM
jgi:hypothetical protein